MRIILVLFAIFICFSPSVLAQTPQEMQEKMKGALDEMKKMIADIEKQLEVARANGNESKIKDLEYQLNLLKPQLKMMEGLDKGITGMSDAVYKEADREDQIVPKKDLARINTLPARMLTSATLVPFVKNVHAEIERLIPAGERTEANKIYNQTKAKYKTIDIVANAASSCWMMGSWEKALLIMGKACLEDLSNTDNLANYAAFLSMSGAEHAALPILQYLNKLYPGNSTLLNNIGQAWFGLGDMANARKWLDSATLQYPDHSLANATLSRIYLSKGDSQMARSYLKASIKETFDTEREAELKKLGYVLKFSDLPEFPYPMKKDPYEFAPFFELLPEQYQTNVNNPAPAIAIKRFMNGVSNLSGKLVEENVVLKKKWEEQWYRISTDSAYSRSFLDPHINPAHHLALRSMELWYYEKFKAPYPSPLNTKFLFPLTRPFQQKDELMSPEELFAECISIYEDSIEAPLKQLAEDASKYKPANPSDCAALDRIKNAYLQASAEIRANGIRSIKRFYKANAQRLDQFIRRKIYSEKDTPPLKADLTYELVSAMDNHRWRNRNVSYEAFLGMTSKVIGGMEVERSACDLRNQLLGNPNEIGDDLVPLSDKELRCEFKKTVNGPLGEFTFECNYIIVAPELIMYEKDDPVQKGQGQSSRKRNQSKGPLHKKGKGPFTTEDVDEGYIVQSPPPLNPESQDPSQYSIEFDKWGNLSGLHFQLNKERDALADPDAANTDMDSRWSWISSGLGTYGFLNKLVIKKQ